MSRGVDEIRKGDVGTVFERQIKDGSTIVDVSSASVKQIIFQKPDVGPVDGVFITKTAVLSGDGTDGKIRYVSLAGVLDEIGVWKWQGAVTLSSGGPWKTNIKTFEVHKNLE